MHFRDVFFALSFDLVIFHEENYYDYITTFN